MNNGNRFRVGTNKSFLPVLNNFKDLYLSISLTFHQNTTCYAVQNKNICKPKKKKKIIVPKSRKHYWGKKGENAGYHHFQYFHQCFQKPSTFKKVPFQVHKQVLSDKRDNFSTPNV